MYANVIDIDQEEGKKGKAKKIVNTFWNVIDFIIMCSKINLFFFL
jgi:hypothetical protein